jgi:hypothetical protein
MRKILAYSILILPIIIYILLLIFIPFPTKTSLIMIPIVLLIGLVGASFCFLLEWAWREVKRRTKT